jgi:dolichyl-phosphate beta-glucosyltransferase
MIQSPYVSIIIPAHNEERRLPRSLDQIIAWQQTVAYEVELLVVENGSTDRTTEIVQSYCDRFLNIRLLHSGKGKGAAIREGILQSRGEYLFVCDADLSMPITLLQEFLSPQNRSYDVIIASRESPGSRRYNEPRLRHMMGRIFNYLVQIIVVRGFNDTQCGFKLFRCGAGHEIFSVQKIDGWTFDVEVIYLAQLLGYRVHELPINWYFDADSRVSPLRDTWVMFWDLIRIRLNHARGFYSIVKKDY